MKLKEGFEVRSVCGENIVVAMGEENIDFTHVISLNETSLFIWQQMENGVDSIEGIVDAIAEEYEVERDVVAKDVAAIIHQLADFGVVEL